jgi:threonine dehydratase
MAKRLGIQAAAVVTTDAPQAKLARLRALDTRIVQVSPEEWWRTVQDCGSSGERGAYIDAVRDPASLSGDGTVGVEILEQLPDIEAIFVSFGGGGLACGIGCALLELNPKVKVVACEIESAQPLGASLRAGRVVTTESNPGFVSGVGFHTLLPEMWPLSREVIHSTVTVSLPEVAAAIRVMARENRVIAEGAGAVSVAAALSGRHPYRRVCAVVSGGNLGNDMLTKILAGGVP